jgi:hypothetical protein
LSGSHLSLAFNQLQNLTAGGFNLMWHILSWEGVKNELAPGDKPIAI